MEKVLPRLSHAQLEELMKYPAWKQFGRILIFLSLYFVLAVIGSKINHLIAWIIIWFIQGFLLAGSLVVVHDCSHNTFIPNKKLCRVMGAIIGSILWVNFSLYKCLHLEHHRHTNVEGDTQRVRTYKNSLHYFLSIFHFKFLYRFIELSLKSIWYRHVYCARNEKIRLQIKQDAILLLLVFFTEIIILCIYPKKFAIFYGIPMLIYLAITFFITTAEHSGCEATTNKTLNVRSVKSNPIFRFLFWNFNYHAEHHIYPSIPAPNLIKVHKLIGHYFFHTESSYIKLHLKLFSILVEKSNKRSI